MAFPVVRQTALKVVDTEATTKTRLWHKTEGDWWASKRGFGRFCKLSGSFRLPWLI